MSYIDVFVQFKAKLK